MAARERSFWGWGWADAFPDASARRATGGMVSALLGGAALEVREPPRLDSIQLAAPRVAVPAQLAGFVKGDREARARHTYGRSYRDLARGFAGRFEPAPDLVAFPPDEDAIWALYDFCAARQLALIPFGGGTSVVGGVEAEVGSEFAGAVSVDLGRLDRVVEVDPVSRAARIQAGATGPALERALAAHGFTLRHFPQSFEFSTLGGWIATRAGGHFATLSTHIDDLVESVRMLTPRGVWESRRLPASGAGPSPDRLVLGSEGILGIITEAWMRVRPRRELAQSDLYPTNCRLLDAAEAMLPRVVGDGSSVLLVGFESADHPLEPWMARALEIGRGQGGAGEPRFSDDGAGSGSGSDTARAAGSGSGTGPATGSGTGPGNATESWRSAFLDAPYLFNTLVSLGCVVDTFETACTWNRFEALDQSIREAVTSAMRSECGGGVLSCRFTHVYPDGPAPYYTFVAPGRPGAELDQWRAIKAAASDAIIAGGATITHHHAVGRTHRPWYERERPDPFALALRGAKRAVDPDGFLNPGVLLAPE